MSIEHTAVTIKRVCGTRVTITQSPTNEIVWLAIQGMEIMRL